MSHALIGSRWAVGGNGAHAFGANESVRSRRLRARLRTPDGAVQRGPSGPCTFRIELVNTLGGYPTASMAGVEKPYRVYRGGRVKGRVPLERPPERSPRRDGRQPAKPKIRRPRRRWSWKRRILVAVLALFVLFVIWAVAGYLAFRSGVKSANKRLPASVPPVLVKQGGLILTKPTTILLLGLDHANNDQRVNDFHSDSIMLLHTDPSRHRVVYLSIPRDLRVAIPGHGEQKINAAFQFGGAALAIQAIEGLTGHTLDVNHVMFVDFASFKQVIDAVGGIDINVPEPILSNPFDCPYDTKRCPTWKGWRFAKGKQHMDGRRAEIYSRIRENQLNPADSDITRGERQQAVIRAVEAKLLSFSIFFKLPFSGGDYVKALTTDLSAWQFVQLGWVLKRAPAARALHCRLGGSGDPNGSSDIIGGQENIAVIGMVTGQSAAQPPPPGSGPFGPGCVVGNATFR
jgi:LCP family protein required for cell wall assembly